MKTSKTFRASLKASAPVTHKRVTNSLRGACRGANRTERHIENAAVRQIVRTVGA